MLSEPEPVTPKAKREGLSNLAKRDLIAYTLACDSRYDPAPFHHYIARIVYDAIILRKRKRIIINVPPRHGKSRLVSEEATSLLLGHRPESSIVVASYSSGLSQKAGKTVRRRIGFNAAYRAMFPETQLMAGDQRSDFWRTTKDGSFQAVGLTGGLTGHGADVLIIDDPHKDRAEAESETMRNRVWDWFVSTGYTRLSANGVVVVIMTRWHKDDLAGRLTDRKRIQELREAGAGDDEEFEVINLPAISEGEGDPIDRPKGESLWQKRWTPRRLKAIRAAIGPYEWHALYCGDPADREANASLMNKIKFIDKKDVPAALNQARTWDLAVTANKSSDFNAGARGGWMAEPTPDNPSAGRFFLTHMAHQKSRWLDTKKTIFEHGNMDGEGSRIRMEAVGAFEALFDEVRSARMGKNLVTMFKPTTDKLTRALPWLAIMEAGCFYIVRGEWNQDFLDEVLQFPNGVNDDQVDAVSGLWEETHAPSTTLFYG